MHDPPTTIAQDLDKVFGRERRRMETGEHVEVFRESTAAGERLRYSKRFVATLLGDFRPWTEREWQVLQRLAGTGAGPVPLIAGFVPAAAEQPAQLLTFDAGVTVEHWATLRPTHPDRPAARHVFEDCAHWWALAHHCLRVLDELHERGLVHLDLKADNICIPWDRARSVQPASGELRALRFGEMKLIDFAFSVFTGEEPFQPLPLGRHTRYDYQSPRLLDALGAGRRGLMGPTRDLDWRCDFFSLAAMLWLYLPEFDAGSPGSWSEERHAQAGVLVRRLLDEHHAEPTAQRPHAELIALTKVLLNQADLAASLRQGWTFTAREGGGETWSTPLTRITGTARPSPTAAPGVREPHAAEPVMTADTELPPRLRQRAPKVGVPLVKVAAAVAGVAALGVVLWSFEAPPVPGTRPAERLQEPALAQAPDAAREIVRPAPAAPLQMEPGASSPAERVAGPPVPAVAQGTVAPALPPPMKPAPSMPAPPAGPGPVPDTPGAEAPAAATSPLPPAPSTLPAPAAPSRVDREPPAAARETAEPAESEPVAGDAALDAQAKALLEVQLPQVAAWADRHLAPVLRLADRTNALPRREELRGAVAAARLAPGRPEMRLSVRSQASRRLNEAARISYWDRNNVQEAVDLQVRAFAANPLDSEVAGNLAFLRMRQQPPQIRAARQLALHSLTLPDVRYPLGRVQDWTTLAISSALLGREADARHAWYISLVLAPDRQRQRNAALRAVSIYGERLRPSVEAMLRREFPVERSGSQSGGRRPT